jgi:hypothetical protein
MASAHVKASLTELQSGIKFTASTVPDVRRPAHVYRNFCCHSSIISPPRSKGSCAIYLTAVGSLSLLPPPMKAHCGAGGRSSSKSCPSGPDYWKPGSFSLLSRLPSSPTTRIRSRGWKKSYSAYPLYLHIGRLWSRLYGGLKIPTRFDFHDRKRGNTLVLNL